MFDRGFAVSPLLRVHGSDRLSREGALLTAVAELPPGPATIRLLAQVRPEMLDDHERAEFLDEWERCSRWVAAQQTKAVVAVAGERATTRDDSARELVRVSLRGCGGSPKSSVDTARALAGPLRAVRDAMEAGELSYDHARVIAQETASLDPATRAEVAAGVLPRAGGCTPAELRRKARRAAFKADPLLAEERARLAARERRVSRSAEPDAQASMFLLGPATDIQTVWSALDVLAARTDADDARTLDQRRFDSLVGLAACALEEVGRGGRTRCGVRPGVYLFADAATWAGLADEPVELDGYGPIPAGIARDYLSSSTWHAVVTDALTGAVQSVSGSRYVPSPRLRRHLHVADRHCLFPGCGAAVWFCDADHDLPYAQGGCTYADNCGLLCRRHHRLKTLYGWTWLRRADGSAVWIDPITGRSYERDPVRYQMPPPRARTQDDDEHPIEPPAPPGPATPTIDDEPPF